MGASLSMLKIQIILLFFGIYATRKELREVLKSQQQKGLTKYRKTLKDCDSNAYDWRIMAIEEMVDFMQYVFKLRNKL